MDNELKSWIFGRGASFRDPADVGRLAREILEGVNADTAHLPPEERAEMAAQAIHGWCLANPEKNPVRLTRRGEAVLAASVWVAWVVASVAFALVVCAWFGLI